MELQAGAAALKALNRFPQAQKLRALAGGLTSILNALKKCASAIDEGPPPKRSRAPSAAHHVPSSRLTADALAARDAVQAVRENLTAEADAAIAEAAKLAVAEAALLAQG